MKPVFSVSSRKFALLSILSLSGASLFSIYISLFSLKTDWTDRGARLDPPWLPPNKPLAITDSQRKSIRQKLGPCVINLYGLPRSFQSLVLPSLVENVLIPNAPYGCDYYVHYHYLEQEAKGRSGAGGRLNPDEILLLEEQVRQVAANAGIQQEPIVAFANDTEPEFWRRRGDLIEKIRTTRGKRRHVRGPHGNLIYFPLKDGSSRFPTTTDNIVRMWHSQEAVWNLMTEHAAKRSINYTRVAMLRSDVVFVTEIDIYRTNESKLDDDNRHVMVPGFAKWPVNDRLIYGPYEAVKIWASQRFARLDRHIQLILEKEPGFGMHSERYLYYTIFPAIQQAGFEIQEDANMCFLRARSDETIWLNDCGKAFIDNNKKRVEALLGRTCRQSKLDENIKKGVVQLQCSRVEIND